MGVFDRQIATAKRMIAAKGQAVTWVKSGITPDVTQPWKATEVPPNPASYPVKIVFVTPGGNMGPLFRLLTGSEVPTGAPAGLMAAVSGFTPAINDSVNRAGVNLIVKSIDIVAPNGEIILYKITFA
jgi:hypothetical protein